MVYLQHDVCAVISISQDMVVAQPESPRAWIASYVDRDEDATVGNGANARRRSSPPTSTKTRAATPIDSTETSNQKKASPTIYLYRYRRSSFVLGIRSGVLGLLSITWPEHASILLAWKSLTRVLIFCGRLGGTRQWMLNVTPDRSPPAPSERNTSTACTNTRQYTQYPK